MCSSDLMLVIMIIGAAAILVSALSSSSLQIERDKTTAAALAKAKDALIAYAVSDANRPGELPCPDFNNDGASVPTVDYNGSSCQSLVGWLPWKTLGLPDFRDGNGDRLWYALANPFHANGAATFTLNSDTPTTYQSQMLAVQDGTTGATLQTNVVAVVFSSGTVLSGQIRSSNDNNATNAITNYLEGSNANPTSVVTQTANNTTINDRLLAIGSNELMAPVEMRIAREAKRCLDDYAATVVAPNTTPGKKYPWAAPVTDNTYTGTYNTLFGRISSTPNIDTTSDGPGSNAAITLSGALSALQTALNAFNAIDSGSNYTALYNAANTVISLKYSVSGISSSVDQAGDYAKYFANDSVSYGTANYYITNAVNALANHNLASIDSTMSSTWPASCTLFATSYWPNWQNEVFYQVASGFQPGSSASFGIPLSINGAGSYRASVIVARQAFPSQIPRIVTSDTSYLEGANQHQTTPSSAFVTYSPSTANYSTVNDLVLCLDGSGTNPGSICK